MKRRPSVFTALLDINDATMLAHDLKGIHSIQLGGQMDGCQVFLIQNASVDATAKRKRKIYEID
jgi:hypothetical protein